MKIDKLYTLSQFIDLMRDWQYKPEMEDSVDEFMIKKLGLIIRYNKFIKQPLKKSMFVNGLEKPKSLETAEKYLKFEAWQEAEKKVIFKGWEYESGTFFNKEYMLDEINTINGHNTLEYLSGHFNGELELKNIEL